MNPADVGIAHERKYSRHFGLRKSEILTVPREGFVQHRLLQRRKQGVLPGVDGGEALGGDGGSPNGANHLSPGQRPGNRHEIHQALKGRFNPTYTVRRR